MHAFHALVGCGFGHLLAVRQGTSRSARIVADSGAHFLFRAVALAAEGRRAGIRRPEKTVCHRAEPQYGNRYSGALLRAAQFPVGFEAGGIQDALFGEYLVLHGDICIDRGRAAEAMEQLLCKGKRWISRGASIAIFPEGTRSKDGEIHRFKAGAFTLAKEAGVEILPVVLDGTKSLIRRNLLFNWGNRITLRILPPVPVERVVSADLHELMEEVHDAMCGALAEIRQAKH